jgi:hypothetical protein
MIIEDEKNTCKSLNKTRKNLNCVILDISKKKINKTINFLDYTRLGKIDCSHNKIECLDNVFPDTVFDLNCSYNKIKLLDYLPPQLRVLDCSHNQIIKLDLLPDGIIKLDCSYNQLINLNDLPNGIEFLFCNNNEIKTLNCLPRNLKYLYCYDNNKNIELKNLPASIEKILN